jgi:hypothetical protein
VLASAPEGRAAVDWLLLLFFVAIYQPSTSRPPRKSSVADGFGDPKNSEMSAVLPLFFAVLWAQMQP